MVLRLVYHSNTDLSGPMGAVIRDMLRNKTNQTIASNFITSISLVDWVVTEYWAL